VYFICFFVNEEDIYKNIKINMRLVWYSLYRHTGDIAIDVATIFYINRYSKSYLVALILNV